MLTAARTAVRSNSAVKILVPIKRVPDPATTIRVLPDGSGIATDNVKWVINPFCEIAIEEALRIKEMQTGKVVLISVGQSTWQEQLPHRPRDGRRSRNPCED